MKRISLPSAIFLGFLIIETNPMQKINIYKKNNYVRTLDLKSGYYCHEILSFSADGRKFSVIGPHSLRVVEFPNLNKYRDCNLVDAMRILYNNIEYQSKNPSYY